jgi:regulator of nucleoside diphosphate kinase
MENVMSDYNRLPPITLTIADSERLERLAHASMARFPQTADYLAREIERARIVKPVHDGPNFVRMGSWVDFRDDRTGQVRHVMLVYPDQADISAGKLSVLTPVGAALIGLSKDQSIQWQTPAGDWRSLTILSIDDARSRDGRQRAGRTSPAKKDKNLFGK